MLNTVNKSEHVEIAKREFCQDFLFRAAWETDLTRMWENVVKWKRWTWVTSDLNNMDVETTQKRSGIQIY